MKHFVWVIFLFMACRGARGQTQNEGQLQSFIDRHSGDSNEVNALAYLGNEQENPDSGLIYAEKGLDLSRQLQYKKGEGDCLAVLSGAVASRLENSGKAIVYALDAINIYKETKDSVGLASVLLILQDTYWQLGDYKKALDYAFYGLGISERNDIKGRVIWPGHRLAPLFLSEIGQTYVLKEQLDSALFYTQQCLDQKELFNHAEFEFAIYLLATIQNMQGNYTSSLANYRKALPLTVQENVPRDTLQIYAGMSTLFNKTGKPDSAIYYAKIVTRSWNHDSELKNLLEALNDLASGYRGQGKKDSAIKYMELGYQLKDSILNVNKDREIQNITFNEELKQQEILADQLKFKSKVQLYGFVAGSLILVLVAVILWRNNIQKQKAKTKIEKAYAALKATQSQLIQSEKMASLGELTAGIAHEIQNPLNFVNNFSEVNMELITEMEEAVKKENKGETTIITESIRQNLGKILHHGSAWMPL
jgi:two-component system NtrC family sensor kinase